jgi:hypothetical protein
LVRRGDSTIVHLISFLPSRLGDGLDLVLDPFPLVDVPIEIRSERNPNRVSVQPQGNPLQHSFIDGYVRVNVTLNDGHGMIVIE